MSRKGEERKVAMSHPARQDAFVTVTNSNNLNQNGQLFFETSTHVRLPT